MTELFAILAVVILVFFMGSIFQTMEMCYRIYKKDDMWRFNAVYSALLLIITVILVLCFKLAGGV